MHIAVFVKQVPDTSEIQIDRTTNRLIRDGVPSILNPFDCFAVETALRLKEKHGGTITVITMGPKQAVSVLKKCCALGFDNAYLLNDIAFAGSDTYSTGYILSTALTEIEKIHGKADLILVGKQAIDGRHRSGRSDYFRVSGSAADHLRNRASRDKRGYRERHQRNAGRHRKSASIAACADIRLKDEV